MRPGPSTSLLGFSGSLEKERYWAPLSWAGGLTEMPAVAMPNTDWQTDHFFSRGLRRGGHVSERQGCPPHFTTEVAPIVIVYLKLHNSQSISILSISFRMCDNPRGRFVTHIFSAEEPKPQRGEGSSPRPRSQQAVDQNLHLGLSQSAQPPGPPASLFH